MLRATLHLSDIFGIYVNAETGAKEDVRSRINGTMVKEERGRGGGRGRHTEKPSNAVQLRVHSYVKHFSCSTAPLEITGCTQAHWAHYNGSE